MKSKERYKQRIEWLFRQYPAFQKVGEKAYKPTLENTLKLIRHFGIDLNAMRFIHVAGTNGKGTTASIIASDLQESGLKTGLFTSPHLRDFRERIRVDGQMIDAGSVAAFIDEVQQSEFPMAPSFFEISWVLALQYFESQSCDVVVVETGLGGRLDATNVITPLMSVITNIGLDHTAILGDTLSEIAYEKAGIIKSEVPVVIGEHLEATRLVFDEISEERNAPLHYVEEQQGTTTFETNR
ncbi:MAG: bifunctional folylpolyglutamate synthase/dihydrofolate synthase, partial [Bacteroidota bacterium]